MPGPGTPAQWGRRAGPSLGTRTRGPSPGLHDPADGGDPAVRGLRNPVSTRRARRPRTPARPLGAMAPHRAGQHPAATSARTVVLAVQRRRHRKRLRRPHRRQPGRPDRPGIPPSPGLRPGPHRRVLRRRRILPRLRRTLLLPPLASVRERLRLLPPRPRQEPGSALVGPQTRRSRARTYCAGRGTCDPAAELGFRCAPVRIV